MNGDSNGKFPLIGDKAPSFKAMTSMGEINFPADYRGKWIVFFSHPGDFTPVCTTEFMLFGSMQKEFDKLNTQLVGLSIGTVSSHIAWTKEIKEKIKYKGFKNIEIKFPIIEDIKMEVVKKYGMIHPNASKFHTVRAVFVIDPMGKVKAILYYPSNVGRNMSEIKRLVIALQKSAKDNVSIPADWQPGEDVILRTIVGQSLSKKESKKSDVYCPDWFLCFKKDKKSKK